MTVMPDDLAARHRAQQGDRIRKARQAAGRTQRDLAAALNAIGSDVTVQAVSLWETGERFPAHKHQVALANVLNLTWSDLFAPDGEDAA